VQAPSISTVFPGQNSASLKAMAAPFGRVGTKTAIFPKPADNNYNAEVSSATFIYDTDTAGANFLSGTSNTVNQMTGIGLAYFAGPLTISAGSYSSWAGIVYVNGNAYIQGPGDISGILVATGSITIGNSPSNKATVEYNSDAINTAEQLLQNFSVNVSSVVVTSQ